MDQGILCITSFGIYLIYCIKINGEFESPQVFKIFESKYNSKEFSCTFMEDKVTLSISCQIWSNPIFIGRFNL